MSRLQKLHDQFSKLMIPLPELETFTKFPELPPELRARVWRFVSWYSSEILLEERNSGLKPQFLLPNGPSILFTSRESRTEAKRYYTLCRMLQIPAIPHDAVFSWPAPQPLPPVTKMPLNASRNAVWVNFDVDSFVFRHFLMPHFGRTVSQMSLDGAFDFDVSAMTRIQHLVIETNGTGLLMPYLTALTPLLRHGSLQSLVVRTMFMVNCQEYILFDYEMRKNAQEVEEIIALIGKRNNWKVPVTVEIGYRRRLELKEYGHGWSSSQLF
ncbi:hypothetical protein L207DRAFT_535663 [Hyaloscypha variabilis F]|uniref:2EXR domain-containing protein n=1 Tax=Hyaloscypha variabilis (strain UAMH 11265 / GT02V1 / F) TaxID=1149755 RepID=A0A2J6R348_HYAVF|nr:hypothetical protein L207DRAFT_535663 [Hyaloscypha variabilis F]